MNKFRQLVTGITVFLAIIPGTTYASTKKLDKPNIVLFLSDDQTKYDYGIYGNEKVNTPVTDTLAKDSLVFDQMFTAEAICAPSRAVLYSGKYPIRNGLFINHISFREGTTFIPDYLNPLGYETVLAGKQHVKPKNTIKWTHVFGIDRDSDKEKAKNKLAKKTHDKKKAKKKGNKKGKKDHASKEIPYGDIDNYLTNVNDQPFFMVVASSLPHGPYPELSKYTQKDIKAYPYQNKVRERPGYYTNIDKKEAELDFVIKSLKKNKLYENTVFIYASDHGNSQRSKYTVYDSGLNVPFIVRWPGVVKPGRTKALASFADFLPTIVEIAGGKVPADDVDGKSFLPLLNNKTERHNDVVFGLITNQGTWGNHVFPQRSARGERFHYIYNFNSMEQINRMKRAGEKVDPFLELGALRHGDQPEEELYDTQADPYEMTNIAKNPEYKAIKAQLKSRLGQWMKQQNDFLSFANPITPYFITVHPLDESNKVQDVPKELQNTVTNYVDPHTLLAKK